MDEKFINEYGADSIVEEKGAEKHRRAVSRYLGATNVEGVENQLFEIIDNAVDESVAYSERLKKNGTPRILDVFISINDDDSVTVIDHGRGLPCGKNKDGIPAIYLACEEDSAGGKNRGTSGYQGTGTAGTHGAGMAVAKSCTEYFKLNIDCQSSQGKYYLEYKYGERVGELKRIGELDRDSVTGEQITGTRIDYKYDESLFSQTLDGNKTPYMYSKYRIEERLKHSLVGQKANIRVIFKYKDSEPTVYDKETMSPINVFNFSKNSTLVYQIDSDNELQPFKAEVYLEYSSSSPEVHTIVNRLRMKTATSNRALISAISQPIIDTYERLSITNPADYPQNLAINENSVKRQVKALIILSLPSAEYSGQTKENLVSDKYQSYFYRELKKAVSDDANFSRLIMNKIIEEEKLRYAAKQYEAKKRKEQEKKLEREKAKSQKIKDLRDTLGDPLQRNKALRNSRIQLRTAPAVFKEGEVTLVYVEGRSALTVLDELHKTSPKPIAIAGLEGKITNLYEEDGKYQKVTDLDEISLDNYNFCLGGDPNSPSYKDIAIYTDADDDGVHIRLLLIAQILKLRPNYLKEGRVFIIPTAYGSVSLRQPVKLNVYGQLKLFQPGTIQTMNRKEHDLLLEKGAIELDVYRGLADTYVNPIQAITDRSKWIRVAMPTASDISLLRKVLLSKSEFKKFYTSDLYTAREFQSKRISTLKSTTEIKKNKIESLEESFVDVPDMEGYDSYISPWKGEGFGD